MANIKSRQQQQQQQEGMQKFAEARKQWKAELEAEDKKAEEKKLEASK